MTRTGPAVAVIGAGGSGLAMAKVLSSAGIPYRVFEKANEVGGTWRDNTYPGLVVDVPGSVMAFSFERDTDSRRLFPTGAELQRYVSRVADTHGLRPHIEFGADVVEARWSDDHWELREKDGPTHSFEVLVHATGFLHTPRIPDIAGLSDFGGDWFHSARWDHDVDLAGARVGVVGTGSSGVQIVGALARTAGQVVHFARTPQWILPIFNPKIPPALRRRVANSPRATSFWKEVVGRVFADWIISPAVMRPGAQRNLIRWASQLNLRTVKDPQLRRRLTPGYEPLCKRPVFSSNYYAAIQRRHVELADAGIDRVLPTGIRTVDGRLHELDVLVLATGFDAHSYMRPMQVYGKGGISLDDVWVDGPRAYNTMAIAGFPNMFMLIGPHSPLLVSPIWDSAERQAAYIVQLLDLLRRRDAACCAPTAAAGDRWYEELRAAMPPTVWGHSCQSWYMAEDGVAVQWPWTRQRWQQTFAHPDPDDFDFT